MTHSDDKPNDLATTNDALHQKAEEVPHDERAADAARDARRAAASDLHQPHDEDWIEALSVELEEAELALAEELSQRRGRAPGSDAKGPRSTIFVVENDLISLHVMRVILSSAGYAIELFDRPEPLLSRLSPAARGCVVTALKLPGLDGLSLFRAAREREVMLPFAFVSGKASVEEAMTAMKHGAVDFLTKPIAPGALLAVVDRALLLDAKDASERAEGEAARARWMSLSAREQHICRLAAQDWLNKQIALELGVSESAVQRQRANAFNRLGVRGVGELTRLLERIGDEESPGALP